MLKVSLYVVLNVIAHTFALHNFLPINEAATAGPKKNIYTSFVPPSAERFFAASVAPSTKAIAPQLLPSASPNAPYFGPYPYQTQYPSYPYRQQYPNPYYPGVFYPPLQQYVYPGGVGPSPVVYVPRYPVPAESGSEQGASSGSGSGSGSWASYFPQSWPSWGSYFPNWSGSTGQEGASGAVPASPASVEGASSQAGSSASAASSNRGKPEKLESSESTPSSQDTNKLDADDKNAVTVELPEQQYVLVGQPQFFGHLAAFPTDRDPTTLNGAAKGAVSSFLFYKDQIQQAVPQRFNDISSGPGSASLAYQRFLLLSKQRSEDGPKPANKSESESQADSSTSPPSPSPSPSPSSFAPNSNSTAASAAANDAAQQSPAKSSAENGIGNTNRGGTAEIAQATPNAVAFAGIGGVAGAAPVGTAFTANNGLASSAPRATAIAGTGHQSADSSVVPAKTILVARYTPQRKYHIDTVVL